MITPPDPPRPRPIDIRALFARSWAVHRAGYLALAPDDAPPPPPPAAPCRHEAVTYVVLTGRLTCNQCGEEL